MKRARPADADDTDTDQAPSQGGQDAGASRKHAIKKANTLDSFLGTRAAQRPACLGISEWVPHTGLRDTC